MLPMGLEKHELIDREDRRVAKARPEGLRCSLYSGTISYGGRSKYFESDYCGARADEMSEDD
jgi:hypothetical protein